MVVLIILRSFYRCDMTPQVYRSYLGPFLPIPIMTFVPFVLIFSAPIFLPSTKFVLLLLDSDFDSKIALHSF
jgi:hypothetical protein